MMTDYEFECAAMGIMICVHTFGSGLQLRFRKLHVCCVSHTLGGPEVSLGRRW